MGMTCTVCNHPQRNAIEALVSLGIESERSIAKQFTVGHLAIHRHKAHIGRRIENAVERKDIREADEFLDHIRSMMAAGAKGVEVGQKAAALLENDPATLYRMTPAFMAQGLRAAELLGQATGRLNASGATGAVNVNLQIVIPRAIDATLAITPELPAIDVQALEPGEPPEDE